MFKKVAKKSEGNKRRVISSEEHEENENLPPVDDHVCIS
jgi:hypothetical protein